MVRIYIDLPKDREYQHRTHITSRDAVANLLIYAMKRQGFVYQPNTPARWGFGVIAKKITHPTLKNRVYTVERVIVGSAEPDIASPAEI